MAGVVAYQLGDKGQWHLLVGQDGDYGMW